MIDLVRRGQTNVYGQVSDVVVRGLTATNLVKNGSFEGGASYWINVPASGAITISSEKAYVGTKSVKQALVNQAVGPYQDIVNLVVGHKYYFSSMMYLSSYTSGNPRMRLNHNGITSIFADTSKLNQWQRLSRVIENALPSESIKFEAPNVGTFTAYIDAVMAIDLTATFGAGNEPTKEQCDAMFPHWFDGTKSTNSVRVKSVGKNLFDGNRQDFVNRESYPNPRNVTFVDNTIYATDITSGGRFLGYNFPVKVGNPYVVSWGAAENVAEDIPCKYTFSDTELDSWAGNTNTNTLVKGIPITATGKWLQINFEGVTGKVMSIADIQVEEGSVATEYEPYKESIVYINTGGELRSVGSVKDEFNVTTGVETQRNKKYVLQASDIVSITPYTTIVIAATKVFDDILYSGSDAQSIYIPPYKSGLNYPATLTNSVNINCVYMSGDEKQLKIVFPPETTLEQARTALAGLTLTYQLATPIVTQLDPMPITIFPNGSRWIEFGNKEIAEYADGIAISNTETPILELKKVDKLHIEDGHWKRTSINLTDVTVVSDGLSLTIANAANGEIYEVEWDYDSALSTKPDLEVGEPSLITRNNRTIVL